MAVKRPTPLQIAEIGASFGMSLTDDDVAFFMQFIGPSCAGYDALQQLPDDLPVVEYPRTPGHFPEGEENRYNAWYVKTQIKGAPTGKLAGKTIVLKDQICLAGVPMMNGGAALEGYVPELDATVVTRVLDAGATVLGKAQCEYYCFSATSFTSSKGPVHNPHKMGHSAGGSSSGCAALVAAGEIDMALGCDQGGSIRGPAALCGIYGMKPTHGLVPYTGIIGMDPVIDHVGPMTATVADNALLLEVLAGPDGIDPRQYDPPVRDYTEALGAKGQGLQGFKIAVVKEGFGHPLAIPAVHEKVRSAAAHFSKLGATVTEVSLPMHQLALAIWSAIATEGPISLLMKSAAPAGTGGLYIPSLVEAHSAAWCEQADNLPDTVKFGMLLGEYFQKHFRGRFYGKARNLLPRATAGYNAVLEKFDLLLMPTASFIAAPLPGPDSPREYTLARSFELLPNTAPFNATHHPAMNVPCGVVDGLPVGMMLIGKHFDEMSIYRAAHAFEQTTDWKRL